MPCVCACVFEVPGDRAHIGGWGGGHTRMRKSKSSLTSARKRTVRFEDAASIKYVRQAFVNTTVGDALCCGVGFALLRHNYNCNCKVRHNCNCKGLRVDVGCGSVAGSFVA